MGEGSTKGEYQITGGRINDLAWDGDSARIIAVGSGKETYGRCITADSGNSVGEISGHSSSINSVSIRQQRPLRAATASDDASLVFYHGAPFKFNTSLRKHNRFVYGVAFSPDGALLVSVGADKKIWLYDGKTGEAKAQIGEEAHIGSIFSVSWAQNSRHFVTSSADQTVKIWDLEAGKSIQTWRMGEEGSVSVSDHQVGVVWPAGRTDGLIVSLNLAGDLTYLSEGTSKPQRVVHGHQKNVTTITTFQDSDSSQTLFTGSSDGRICAWDIASGTAQAPDGEQHTNYVSGITASAQGRIYSVGWDDSLRAIDASVKAFLSRSCKTDGQPSGVAIAGNTTVVATHKGLEVTTDFRSQNRLPTKYSPCAIAATNTIIAVSGDNHILHIYTPSLSLMCEIPDPSSLITALSFSPAGDMLAAGFSSGKITVYETASWEPAITRWSSHTGRVMCIAWNAEGTHAVSGGLDADLYLWSVKKPGRRVGISGAHKEGVNGVVWALDGKIVSVGCDAAVKVWRVEVGE